MAKRMRNAGIGELEEDFSDIPDPPSTLNEYIEPITVRLKLIKDVRLEIIGKVTGKVYYFGGAGSELDVDKDDAEIMMKKQSGAWCDGCPSSSGPQPYFELVR